MQSCPSENNVLDFLEGRLSEKNTKELHEHVDRCPACQAIFANLAPEFPEFPAFPAFPEALEFPQSPEALAFPQRPEAREATEASGATEATEATDATEATEATDATDADEQPRQSEAAGRGQDVGRRSGAIVGGRYRLERFLGAGGMGTVWACTHLITRQPVALKFLHPLHGRHPEGRLRVLREARAMSAVGHPNVVRLHDAFEADGSPVLVMDLLQGEPLSGLLARRGALSLVEAARVLKPVFEATRAAHRTGIVHRDLKPDNIFLAARDGDEPEVRVLDFGVAKLLAPAAWGRSASSPKLTGSGEIIGTPFYMSPEQFYGEPDVDGRADIWALGVVLYECLTGRRPFEGDNFGQVLKRATTMTYVPLRRAAPSLPPDVVALVERMIQSDRNERLPDLDEAIATLDRHATGAAGRAGRLRRGGRWLAAAALAAAGGLAWQSKGPPVPGTWGAALAPRALSVAAPAAPAPGSSEGEALVAPSAPIAPAGTWQLLCNGYALTATIRGDAHGYQGTLSDPSGWAETIDEIAWDEASGELTFRRVGASYWQWHVGRVVEGVLVGRFSESEQPARPSNASDFRWNFTGWREETFDHEFAPRVYEYSENDMYRGRLRLDRAADGQLVGRMKPYSTRDVAAGEHPEDELMVSTWDGNRLVFERLLPFWQQSWQARASGLNLKGTMTQKSPPAESKWSGRRAEVLSYGLVPRPEAARAQWQERTRRRLAHLIMAGNPEPLRREARVVRSDLVPAARDAPSELDDGPTDEPTAYRLDETEFDYELPDPDGGGAPLARRASALLATPEPLASGARLRAVVALHDHGSSAQEIMARAGGAQQFGDAFARRGFVVLALDVSHRGDGPLYEADREAGLTRPSIKAEGMRQSSWEDDGERAWDALRAVEYLRSLPFVDPERVIVAGLGLGGAVATLAAALDPRVAMAVTAGYAPDFGVLGERDRHPCWRWAHADLREYLDVSDLYALVAPRPLVVETGANDFSVSRSYPLAAVKQVARRVRAAYGDQASNFVHFVHEGGHAFRFGGPTPAGGLGKGVTVPVLVEPSEPGSRAWQSDRATEARWPTLFSLVPPGD